MIWAYLVAKAVYEKYGNAHNCVITSGAEPDPEHTRSSEHYKGDAIDLRVWGFKDISLPVEPSCDVTGQQVADEIQANLTDEFEVFFEGDHIHIGFDPEVI